MIDVGIVGCGFIGRIHSLALKSLVDAGLVDARVTHVADADAEKAGAMARHHGAEVSRDPAALVDAVDAVWVCTPTAAHLDVVDLAAGAGTAVMCEKPLGRDLAEARRVAESLARVPHRVGLVLRCAPVFRRLRAELEDGRHGRPMAVVFRDDQSFPLGGPYGSTWRADVAQAGSGTLLEHSIHDVDLLAWLFGAVSSVAAQTANHAGHEGVEDVAAVSLTFASGALGTLASVWHQVATRPSMRRVEVFCENALLWLDDDDTGPLHLQTSSEEATLECPPPAWADALPVPADYRSGLAQYAAPAKEFLDDLAAGVAPRGPGAREALAAHGVVDAAYRSAAAQGSPIRL